MAWLLPAKSAMPGVSSSSSSASSSSPRGIGCNVKVSALPMVLLVFKSLCALLPAHGELPVCLAAA